jgi:pyruvate ferredoxin oxidoreductase alpha subunit
MASRDCGWVQTFAENGQECFDLILHAFRVAEDPTVSLPVIVNFDGFIVSHVVEPIEMLSRAETRTYLPPFAPLVRLDPRAPITIGPVGIPEIYTETRMAHDVALRDSKAVVQKGFDEFEKLFGRKYNVVETYHADDAETLLLTMGGVSETAMTAIDELRAKGVSVGLVRLRLWRPFPFEELRAVVKNAKVLAVIDRCLSTGGPGGPVASEVKAALYHDKKRPQIVEFIAGLGGRDVRVRDIVDMYAKVKPVLQGGPVPPFELIGVRS